ncbi:MAG: hypothetical protein ABJ239_06310 [Erythrobacter sp.]
MAAIALASLVLTSCGSSRPRFSEGAINRALANAPGAAQPSTVVKAELEYARAVREESRLSAATQFAGTGAVIHGPDGPVDAATYFAENSGSEIPDQWEPRSVWMSCSGRLAVSQGRYTDASGLVGNYITVWEQRRDRNYKWVYALAVPDNPQPPPRAPAPTPGPDDIVVTSIDAVAGLVADCPRPGSDMPIAPAVAITDDTSQGGRMSQDGTLRWRWEHSTTPNGSESGRAERRFVAEWLTSGKWQVGLDETLSAPQE